MDNFFKFSHTIQVQSNSSEDQYENLFRIGGTKIERQQKPEKKQKKEKKEKKEKKHKKHRKHKRQKQQIEQSDKEDHQQKQQALSVMKKLQSKVSDDRYYQIQPLKTIDDILSQQFALNQKIIEGGLPINILKFGDENLVKFGVQDKDVPVFSRDRSFPYVVGMKRNRKSKKVVKQLNKVINQKPLQPQKEDNYDRYYHFEGYDSINPVSINQLKQKNNAEQVIKFDTIAKKEEFVEKPEDKLKTISKQLHKQLNQNPKNVQIWLKFTQIQDRIGELSGQKSNLLLERKMSIVEKALKYNEESEELALIYLKMLQSMTKERGQIQKKALELINMNPQSSELWIFYLEFRISNFREFCHTGLQKNFEQIDKHLQINVEKAKSAVHIWKIRKASLVILNKVLKVFRLQGYTELVTSICTALLQYNIFAPAQISENDEQRQKQFKNYWQNYSKYRIGEVQNSSWVNNTLNTFVHCPSDYIQNWVEKLSDIKTRQMIEWIPSHTNHHQNRIEQQPQSFIFFEDIQPYLKIYRSQENIQMLLDVFMNNMQMPTIYGIIPSHSFLCKWIQTSLLSQRKTKISVQFPLWNKFWHPKYTDEFLPNENLSKFVYCLRVCKMLRNKNQEKGHIDKKLNEYLLFLYGVIYTHSPLQIYLSSEKCIQQIQGILSSDPTNVKLWAIYIEIESLNEKSVQECVDCFYQCLQIIEEQIDKLWVLYWLKSYLSRNSFYTEVIGLLLVEILLKNSEKQVILKTKSVIFSQETVQIQEMDKLLLSNKLKQFWSIVHKNSENKSIIYYFLLDLGFRSDQMVDQILKMETQLGVHMLMDHHLLTLSHFQEYQLLSKNFYSISVIKYWFSLLPSVKLFTLFISFQKMVASSHNKLLTWLIMMRLLKRQYEHVKIVFTDYFLNKAKELSNKNINNEPECVIILNKMLKDANFVFFCLDELPYCRSLYELLEELSPEKSQKVESLALEKQIRRKK